MFVIRTFLPWRELGPDTATSACRSSAPPEPFAPMNTSGTVYHLGIKGVQSGPFPETELLARLARGELTGTELCWTEGWKDWKPLSHVFPSATSTTALTAAAQLDAPPPMPAPARPAAPAVRIDGNVLVVPINRPFPPVCIRTGATQDLIARPLRCSLSWHTPAIYLAILLNILIYVILALIFRKTSVHAIYLSRTARASQVKWHLANWGLFLGSWVLFGAAISQESGATGLSAFAMVVACVVIYFKKVRLLHAAHIDKTHARIRGIPPEVMAQIVAAWK